MKKITRGILIIIFCCLFAWILPAIVNFGVMILYRKVVEGGMTGYGVNEYYEWILFPAGSGIIWSVIVGLIVGLFIFKLKKDTIFHIADKKTLIREVVVVGVIILICSIAAEYFQLLMYETLYNLFFAITERPEAGIELAGNELDYVRYLVADGIVLSPLKVVSIGVFSVIVLLVTNMRLLVPTCEK